MHNVSSSSSDFHPPSNPSTTTLELLSAFAIQGEVFLVDDYPCVPVWTAGVNNQHAGAPPGFLVTHGTEMVYQSAHTPEGEELLHAWYRDHLTKISAEASAMPAEYWYG